MRLLYWLYAEELYTWTSAVNDARTGKETWVKDEENMSTTSAWDTYLSALTRLAEILTHAGHFQVNSAALLGAMFIKQYHTKLIVARVQEGVEQGVRSVVRG